MLCMLHLQTSSRSALSRQDKNPRDLFRGFKRFSVIIMRKVRDNVLWKHVLKWACAVAYLMLFDHLPSRFDSSFASSVQKTKCISLRVGYKPSPCWDQQNEIFKQICLFNSSFSNPVDSLYKKGNQVPQFIADTREAGASRSRRLQKTVTVTYSKIDGIQVSYWQI